MDFTKTIRFKLTAWYSFLLILICIIFVFVVNVLFLNYYKQTSPQWVNKITPEIREQVFELPANRQKEFLENFLEEKKRNYQEQRERDLENIRNISFISLIPLFILSILSGYFIAGEMLKPLRSLNGKISKINAENLDKKIDYKETGDELSVLVKQFNLMIARLKIGFDLQKQFIENAAHELKTPLAIIKTNLDATLLNKKDYKKKEDIEYIENARRSVDFLKSLIDDLLLLSLVDKQISFEDLKIKELIKVLLIEVNPIAEQKGIHIKLKLKEEKIINKLIVKGNKNLLLRAMVNIIDNAVKYSAFGKNVIINLMIEDKFLIFAIKDEAGGISIKEKEKIFERFYQVDKSRSKNEREGFGLGLAIVKKVINLHDGKIELDSVEGLGSEFRIYLPIK